MTSLYGPLTRLYWCRLPGLIRGRRAQRHQPRHEAEIGVRFAGRNKLVHLVEAGEVVQRLRRGVADRLHRPVQTRYDFRNGNQAAVLTLHAFILPCAFPRQATGFKVQPASSNRWEIEFLEQVVQGFLQQSLDRVPLLGGQYTELLVNCDVRSVRLLSAYPRPVWASLFRQVSFSRPGAPPEWDRLSTRALLRPGDSSSCSAWFLRSWRLPGDPLPDPGEELANLGSGLAFRLVFHDSKSDR